MRILLIALIALAAVSSAATLQTHWSVPMGLSSKSQFASSPSMSVISDSRGVLFAYNVNGTLLWSFPGFSGAIVTVLQIKQDTGDVFANYQPLEGTSPSSFKEPTLYCFDGKTGNQKFTIPTPDSNFNAYGGNTLILGQEFFSKGTQTSFFVNYDLTTGTKLWNISYSDVQLALQGTVTDKHLILFIFAKAGGPGYLTLDLQTGSKVCHVSSSLISFTAENAPPQAAGDLLVVPLLNERNFQETMPALYDYTRAGANQECSKVVTFAANNSVSVQDGSIFVADQNDGSLSRYSGVHKVWTSHGVVSTNPKLYFSIDNTGFNPGAVIVNSAGNFSAINITNGDKLWQTGLEMPFAPKSSSGQQTYPLGNGNLFVPNLQGFIVMTTAKGGKVLAINEMTPIVGTASFRDAAGNPFVVYGDVANGQLIAVGM